MTDQLQYQKNQTEGLPPEIILEVMQQIRAVPFRYAIASLTTSGIAPEFLNVANDYGLIISDDGKLIGISPMKGTMLPNVLISRTPFLTKQGLAILSQMEIGTYGSPNLSHPTYFSPDTSSIDTTQRLGNIYLKVYIDTSKLLSLRYVYTDPEMFLKRDMFSQQQLDTEFPGASFLNFGGVPTEAIIKVEEISL